MWSEVQIEWSILFLLAFLGLIGLVVKYDNRPKFQGEPATSADQAPTAVRPSGDRYRLPYRRLGFISPASVDRILREAKRYTPDLDETEKVRLAIFVLAICGYQGQTASVKTLRKQFEHQITPLHQVLQSHLPNLSLQFRTKLTVTQIAERIGNPNFFSICAYFAPLLEEIYDESCKRKVAFTLELPSYSTIAALRQNPRVRLAHFVLLMLLPHNVVLTGYDTTQGPRINDFARNITDMIGVHNIDGISHGEYYRMAAHKLTDTVNGKGFYKLCLIHADLIERAYKHYQDSDSALTFPTPSEYVLTKEMFKAFLSDAKKYEERSCAPANGLKYFKGVVA